MRFVYTFGDNQGPCTLCLPDGDGMIICAKSDNTADVGGRDGLCRVAQEDMGVVALDREIRMGFPDDAKRTDSDFQGIDVPH